MSCTGQSSLWITAILYAHQACKILFGPVKLTHLSVRMSAKSRVVLESLAIIRSSNSIASSLTWHVLRASRTPVVCNQVLNFVLLVSSNRKGLKCKEWRPWQYYVTWQSDLHSSLWQNPSHEKVIYIWNIAYCNIYHKVKLDE